MLKWTSMVLFYRIKRVLDIKPIILNLVEENSSIRIGLPRGSSAIYCVADTK
jgi:hypothetical protein